MVFVGVRKLAPLSSTLRGTLQRPCAHRRRRRRGARRGVRHARRAAPPAGAAAAGQRDRRPPHGRAHDRTRQGGAVAPTVVELSLSPAARAFERPGGATLRRRTTVGGRQHPAQEGFLRSLSNANRRAVEHVAWRGHAPSCSPTQHTPAAARRTVVGRECNRQRPKQNFAEVGKSRTQIRHACATLQWGKILTVR